MPSPTASSLPEAVIALGASGAFQEPDAAGVFVGFMAGVIGSNPDHAEKLVKKMLKVRPEDNWAVVRAVAYSGLPDWRGMLARTTSLAPNRQAMIDAYLDGKLATLDDFKIPERKSAFAASCFRSGDDGEKVSPRAEPGRHGHVLGLLLCDGFASPRFPALSPCCRGRKTTTMWRG